MRDVLSYIYYVFLWSFESVGILMWKNLWICNIVTTTWWNEVILFGKVVLCIRFELYGLLNLNSKYNKTEHISLIILHYMSFLLQSPSPTSTSPQNAWKNISTIAIINTNTKIQPNFLYVSTSISTMFAFLNSLGTIYLNLAHMGWYIHWKKP